MQMVVDKLKEAPLAIVFGILIIEIALLIGVFNMVIPVTHEKLNKNPTSNTHNGLIKNIIIPAIEIEVRLSYSFPNMLEINNIKDIMLALKIDIEKPHM